ncbi:MAG: hypothetical protein JWO12_267 [Frankiales bacterium]|nr:hypothetical protein [Frankiales bacterium]
MVSGDEVRDGARRVLESSWREQDGFCPPNPIVYPHQWLWDSCFHAIAWAALGDDRAGRELASCLSGALASGFVPHMRYLGPSAGRGPLPDRSSFTQPPIYAHAARCIRDGGLPLPPDVVARAAAGLDWLWRSRLTPQGLLAIVHPWESGSDDSPRWDDWVGTTTYDHAAFSAWDRGLVPSTGYDELGAAVGSSAFVCAPSAFNAFASHAAAELFALTGDAVWEGRAQDLATAIDTHLWDDDQGLWVDHALVGGGESVRIPTLDGALGALCSSDAEKAHRVLDQVADPSRFGASHGVAFLPPDHPRYDPSAYWRGPAWPQLDYMIAVAARRWDRHEVVEQVTRASARGVLASGFAEYRNAETGAGLGAIPQGWAAVAAALVR